MSWQQALWLSLMPVLCCCLRQREPLIRLVLVLLLAPLQARVLLQVLRNVQVLPCRPVQAPRQAQPRLLVQARVPLRERALSCR